VTLNCNKDNQSFIVFDLAMLALGVFGLLLVWAGWFLGGWWLILSALMLLGIVLLAYGVWVEPRRVKVSNFKINLSSQSKVMIKVVFIADLHAGSNKPKKWYDRVFSRIKDMGADLLLVGGDLVVSQASHLNKLEALNEIGCQYGKYFVLGNHDYLDNPGQIVKSLTGWGFHDLTNANLTLRCQGLDLRLAGIDDCVFGQQAAVPAPACASPLILLCHEPDVLRDLAEGQADLVLCGHNHGGQIRWPGLGALFVPSKLGRRVDAGFKVVNGIRTYLTTGLGEVLCRARLFCPPEIVVLEIGI